VRERRVGGVGPRGPGCRLTSRAGPRQAQWLGDPSMEAAGRCRRQLQACLTRWGLDGEVVEDAVLVVAELLANVVVHAGTPFLLAARVQGPLLHLSVSDLRVGAPRTGSANPTAGRVGGLRLVTAVTFRWGWQEHETGKTVWAELIL
jgi:Histidine kinase-like ATPase domain